MAKIECKGCVYLTFLNNNKDLNIRYYVCLLKMKFEKREDGNSIILDIVDEITKRCPFYFSREELEVKDEENPKAETD